VSGSNPDRADRSSLPPPLRHEDPELRRKHLEWIRRVVAAGEYRVPSEDVARAIIGFYRRAE
jgi:anti-sigma28 factor (negative regulator of flagellin synthesis)